MCAILLGAALAISGACYQSVFMNPLVSPGLLGVLAGASFGAGIGFVLFDSSLLATQIFAFAFACCAVGLALLFSVFQPIGKRQFFQLREQTASILPMAPRMI